MSTLTGNKISLTYKSLFKTSDNDVLTAALKQMSDGLGNNSGVYLNTGGDLKSTGTLEFANFKGTSTAVTINKLVNEADGISNNDNDTSLPTSAAVKDYVDTHVTSQDLDFSDGTNQSAVDLDSQVFAIVGTNNEIETTASGQQLQIGLPNSVTISGTYTGATFSGDLNGTINTATTATTQSAGDNSTKVATTAYVDTLDAASDLDFSGTTGTGDVNLNTQTFAVTGTTNQITTAASNQGLQISLLSTGVTMPNNSVATTQSAGDNSTKLATTAYVDVLDAASDLDIAGDSGTGDVNLNTQTFTLSGTTNQVTTAVSGQTATFSLPSTIHRNLQGNVTGDLTGNADTATKWQTARNLSVSGEATGTLSNVDGSSAVSGAVTLTNSAVIGKVLTGLPTPAAGNIQASDSILEAFGKLQSQVSSISNGLIFKGSWDADTNTPTLTSGGGEVESGTTDGATTAFKLIDSSQNFNTTVSIGNKVINQVDGTTALVTVIDSNTQLTLDTNIMLTGEAYTIDASPFIPQGNYYVVNYAGNTNLNGTTDWSIGDWVIADADNRWSKLDHSQVDGQGSPGHLPVFATATTIGDSIVSQAGTALTITGSATTTLGLSSTGDFAVNTNKFTANATTGNVAFPGDLAINTDKFTVNATSGNTIVAGTISVASGTISVLGGNNMTLAGPASHGGISFATNSILPATASATNDNVFDLGATTERFKDLFLGGSITAGGATFAGDIMPSAENLYDIGSASVRWEDIWADQVYGRSVYVDDYIYHNGDTDTYIAFAADRQTYLAGGDEFIDFREATESYITIGNANDTDTRMQGGAGYIFIQGSNGYIGINDATPSYPLEVAANTHIGGTLEIASTSIYQAKIKSTGAQYLLIGSTDAGSAGIILDGDSNGDGSGGDYSYLLHEASGVLKLQQDSPSGTNELHFGTAGIEGRMIISASGNVGIGQAPSDFTDWRVLELKGLTNGSMLNFENSSSVRTGAIAMNDASSLLRLQTMTASGIAFEPNNAEAMRITSGGIVQINTNEAKTSTSTLEFGSFGQSNEATNYSTLQMYTKGGASQADRSVFFQTIESGVANAGNIVLQPSGGNIGISTGNNIPDALLTLEASSHNQAFAGKRDATNYLWFLRNENNSGRFQMYNSSSAQTIEFTGADGAATFAGSVSATGVIFANRTLEALGQNLTHGASRIKICQENTNKSQIRYYGADASTKGSLEFMATTSDGSSSVTPLSIDSSGNVGIGKTGAGLDTNGFFLLAGNNSYAEFVRTTTSDVSSNIYISRGNSGNVISFYRNDLDVAVGSISVTTNATSYNSGSSDKRLKKNITNWNENILDKFKDIKPKEFHFNNQDNTEEKQKGYIAQNEVDKFPEAYPLVYNEEAKEDRHLFNPSGMVVYLMKAIQELKAEVDLLKQECKCK